MRQFPQDLEKLSAAMNGYVSYSVHYAVYLYGATSLIGEAALGGLRLSLKCLYNLLCFITVFLK